MERTTSTIVFVVFALVAAGLLLYFVRGALPDIHRQPINLTEDRGIFTGALPSCDEAACEGNDTTPDDCLMPGCVSSSCAQDAQNRSAGYDCVNASGATGRCDGAGNCVPPTQCDDGRDNATVCGAAVCGKAADNCGK